MEVMMSTSTRYEPQVAKKVYIYRNGCPDQHPKLLIINERYTRDFTTFLNRATSGIRAPVAVRNIYTPHGGHKIQRLQDLKSGHEYVAGGTETFKKVKYERAFRDKQTNPRINDSKTFVAHVRTIQATSRFLNLPEKPYRIHVFRNGDALFRGVRVLLPKKIMHSWENILEIVTEKLELSTPAKRLCTLDGHYVHNVTDIKDEENYVAIQGARRFVRMPYCAINPNSLNTRQPRIKKPTRQLPPLVVSHSQDTSFPNTTIQDKPKHTQIKRLMPLKQHQGKDRPFGGRRNKEARNQALTEAREDSIFGGSPTPQDGQILSTSQDTDGSRNELHIPDTNLSGDDEHRNNIILDNCKDNSGIPDKSSTENIRESRDCDQEVAQEIEPQEEIDNDDANIINTNPTVVELEGESLHKSIDLSVNRVAQQSSSDITKQNSKKGSKVNSRTGSQVSSSRTDSQPKNIPSHNEINNVDSVTLNHTGSNDQQLATRSVSQSGSQPVTSNGSDIDGHTAANREQTAIIDDSNKIQPEVEVGE